MPTRSARKLPGVGSYHEGADHYERGRFSRRSRLLVERAGARSAAREGHARLGHRDDQDLPRSGERNLPAWTGWSQERKTKILPLAPAARMAAPKSRHGGAAVLLAQGVDGEHGVESWRVLRGDPIYLLARLHPGDEDDPVALLHREARARDAARKAPRKGFMTIHKAKGLGVRESRCTVLCRFVVGNDVPSRCRMYVAISRAQSTLHLLIPDEDPTPLPRV